MYFFVGSCTDCQGAAQPACCVIYCCCCCLLPCRAVAAAVIKARDTAADELFHVMPSYSKALGRCTPKDSEQQFKPYSIRGSLAVDKKKAEVPGGRHL